MKKKITAVVSLVVLSTLAIGTGVVLSQKEVNKVEGYSAASLPTTIDLNDTSPTNIRSYYSALNNLDTSERQGTNLLKNLKNILKNGQKYFSYENGTDVWRIYEITDRDWVKSPASSTTYGTYNSSTNKITGYTYGSSASNSKNNPYIHALYVNRNVDNQTTAWDDHNQDQWGINREHVWPKAEGFDTSGAGGARGDPMHLMAGNGYANNIHSNYYYGYVNTSSTYTNCGSTYSNLSGNLRGYSKTLGGSKNVFEPQDCDKGDIARAIFYMVARYNYLSGSDSDGIDTNNPNLTLTQNLSDWASSGYTSTTSNPGKMGILTDLLAWHKADPVDDFERHRNNLLYTNFTNNRNPFVDFPEWVDFIWGTATYNGTTYQSYNSNPTGYAQPNSDTINGYNSGSSSVAVTGVSLDKNSLTLEEGQSETLTATISPNNATDQGITWSSDDYSFATVSNGKVTGISEGSAVITVTTDDGNKTATCNVTVTKASGGQGGGGITENGEYTIGWGTATGTEGTYKNFTATSGSVDDILSFTTAQNNGTNPPAYNEGSSELRLYYHTGGNGGSITITPEEGITFTSAVITTSTVPTVKYSVDGGSLTSVSVSNNTYTISNIEASSSLMIQNANTTNTQLRIKTIKLSYEVESATPKPTSITASVDRAFYVGNTIKKSDITLVDDLGNEITDFEFDDYMFVYEDTGTGGYSSSDKEFEISYNSMYTTLEVEVLRDWYDEPSSVEKTINDFSDITATSYSDAGNFVVTPSGDDVTYYAEGVYKYSNTMAFPYEKVSNGVYKTDAKFYNSTPFDTNILSVEVTLKTGNNQLTVLPTVEYRQEDTNWSTTQTHNDRYFRLSYPDTFSYGYINIESITVTLAGEETPTNVANYIMYEDIEGQCVDKLDTAIGLFYNMSKNNRAFFMTASLESYYVIYTARQRFEAWLLNQGKTIVYDSNSDDYVVSSLRGTLITNTRINDETMFAIITISIVVAITLGAYIIIKKKKQEQ